MNTIDNINITYARVVAKKYDLKKLLIIIEVFKHGIIYRENFIESDSTKSILAKNYVYVVLSLEKIGKLELDLMRLIDNNSNLKTIHKTNFLM